MFAARSAAETGAPVNPRAASASTGACDASVDAGVGSDVGRDGGTDAGVPELGTGSAPSVTGKLYLSPVNEVTGIAVCLAASLAP